MRYRLPAFLFIAATLLGTLRIGGTGGVVKTIDDGTRALRAGGCLPGAA